MASWYEGGRWYTLNGASSFGFSDHVAILDLGGQALMDDAASTHPNPNLCGAFTNRFEPGDVVFNPPSNHQVTAAFSEPRRSAATGTVTRSFTVPAGDGDLFLEVGSTP